MSVLISSGFGETAVVFNADVIEFIDRVIEFASSPAAAFDQDETPCMI